MKDKKTSISYLFLPLFIAVFLGQISGCIFFGDNYDPGEQMMDGVWYAEHNFGLGNRSISGILDDSLIEREDDYSNDLHISMVRKYDDGREVDLLETVRDVNDFVRIAAHKEDNSIKITGLPSWAKETDSYVDVKIFNFGGSGDGQAETFYYTNTIDTDEESDAVSHDFGTFSLKPINSAYSLTINMKYMYDPGTGDYVTKTYNELTSLGFSLSGDNVMAGGDGYKTIFRFMKNITDNEVQNGQIVITDVIAGGNYEAWASISVDGEDKPVSFSNNYIEITDSEPTKILNGTVNIN